MERSRSTTFRTGDGLHSERPFTSPGSCSGATLGEAVLKDAAARPPLARPCSYLRRPMYQPTAGTMRSDRTNAHRVVAASWDQYTRAGMHDGYPACDLAAPHRTTGSPGGGESPPGGVRSGGACFDDWRVSATSHEAEAEAWRAGGPWDAMGKRCPGPFRPRTPTSHGGVRDKPCVRSLMWRQAAFSSTPGGAQAVPSRPSGRSPRREPAGRASAGSGPVPGSGRAGGPVSCARTLDPRPCRSCRSVGAGRGHGCRRGS